MAKAGSSAIWRVRLVQRGAACPMVLALVVILMLVGCARYEVDDVIVIPYPFREPNFPLTVFAHRNHSVVYRNARGERISCGACHHTWEPETGAAPPLCSECHTEFGEDPEVPELTHAYHIRCTACHRENQMVGRPGGPVTDCDACHVPPTDHDEGGLVRSDPQQNRARVMAISR